MKTELEISQDIFYLSEDNIYKMMANLENNQATDKSLVYCFIKAFYLHTAKLYFMLKKVKINFDEIYAEYKENLKTYYKTNNPNIEDEILDQVLNFFDNSFALIGTVELADIEDSYEFRHYIINVFELLRMILENKSKSVIRENIFENYTRVIVEESEKILDYINNC